MFHKLCLNETMNNTEEKELPWAFILHLDGLVREGVSLSPLKAKEQWKMRYLCARATTKCEVGMFGAESKPVTFGVCVLNFKMLFIGSSLWSSSLWSE